MSGIHSSGNNPTVWVERDDLQFPSTAPSYPKLTEDISTEIVVVGAGIAGLQIAYELLSAGVQNVVILEDGKVGSGETGRTTGHLSVDNEYNDFASLHGTKVTADIAAAQQTAIERLSEIVNKHNIDCDFQRLPGYMFQGLAPSSKDYETKTLHELFDAAKETGKISVELIDDAQIKGFKSGEAIKFSNQATFHPTKYVRALAGVISEMGGKIFEQTRMLTSEEKGDGVVSVKTEDGREVRAEKLVMATNVPLQKLVVIDRIEAYRSYAIALRVPTDSISTNGEQALWWDMADPYHYIRITPSKTPGESLLVVGGEDEKVGQHDDYAERYRKLEEWTRERWSGVEEVVYRWSGQISETTDGIAIIGLNPGTKNTYIHTGDNGDGLTYAAVGGLILSSLLTGKDHPWAKTFSPSRELSHKSGLLASVKVLPDLIKENLSDQVYFAKWLTACTKTMADIEDLVPGEGEVVRDGMSAVAVYKEEGGGLRKMTAVCPHLKGIVAWNSDEKSWDCPIHGSRFTCKGDVVNGPSKIGLEPVK